MHAWRGGILDHVKRAWPSCCMEFLAHAATRLSPPPSPPQGYAGSSYNVPDPHPIDETAHVATVREVVKSRFVGELDARKIPHALHICEL